MAGRNVNSNVVIRINDREITNTFRGIGAEVSRLQRELRGMTVGSEEYIRTSQQLRTVRARFSEIRDEINGTQRDTEGLLNIFKGNVAANFFENATSKAMEWGQQLKERVQELANIKSALSTMDGNLKGDDLNKATASTQAIADTYGKSVEEIEGAIKGLNTLTGDTQKSLKLIVDGFDSGADASGEMLTQLKEYPTMMKDAKVSAEQMIAIMSQSEKMGVYDDKGIDAIKEGMLKVREGTKSTKDAMKALGLDVDGIYKQVASGAINYFDVLQMVSGKISEMGANSRLTGTAIADVFGGPGEDAGYAYLSQLKDINTNLDSLTTSTSEAAIAKKAEFEANEKLNNIWVHLTGTVTSLSLGYSKLKSAFADFLSIVFNLKNEDPSEEYLQMAKTVRHLKETIQAVIAVLASYRIGLALTALFTKGAWQQTLIYNVIQKAKVIGENIARGSTLLYAAAKAILTGNITRATIALRMFNTVTKLNPLGLFLSVITAVVAAFVIFRNRVKEARQEIAVLNREQRLAMEQQKGMNKQVLNDVEEMRKKVDPLVKILNDQNKTLQQRKSAYEQLVKIAPEFRGTVDKEYYATLKLGDAYGRLIERITNLAKKRALESLTAEKQSALIREETLIDTLSAERDENMYKMTGILPGGKSWAVDKDVKKLDQAEENVLLNRNKAIGIQIAASRKKIEVLNKDIDDTNRTIKSRYADVFDDKKNIKSVDRDLDADAAAKKEAEAAAKQKLKDANSAKNDLEKAKDTYNKSVETQASLDNKLLEMQMGFEEEKNKIKEDSREKDQVAEDLDYQKKLQTLQKENTDFLNEITKSTAEIEKLQRDKTETKSPAAKKILDEAIKNLEVNNAKRKSLIEANNKQQEFLESTHRFNLKTINEKWDAKDLEEYIKKEGQLVAEKARKDEEAIQNINSLEDIKKRLKNNAYLKLTKDELKEIDTLEKGKVALRELANRKALEQQLVFLEDQRKKMSEAISNMVDGPDKKKLLEELEKLKDDITKIRGEILSGKEADKAKAEEANNKAKASVDVLGFSAKDWTDVFDNLETLQDGLKAAGMVFQALGNAANMFGELQRALGEKELKNYRRVQDRKKEELDKNLALGLISQENYKKQTELLDAELANKQAEIEYKQAKADKASKLFSAIGATAVGVASALSVAPPLGIALAAIVGALGAVQIATIAAQPLPEMPSYAKGGYFEGFTGDSTHPADETGERPFANVRLHRKEWVAPRWMTEHPRISPIINNLEFMRANKITKMAEGGFPETNASGSVAATSAGTVESTGTLMILVTRLLNLFQKIDDEGGIEAYIAENPKNEKKMREMVRNREKLINKQKR